MDERLKNIKSGKGYLDKLYALVDENRKLSLTLIILVGLVFFLGIGLLKVKQNMIMSIEIPEKTYYSGKAQIARDRANPLFYKLWGAYIVNDIMSNYTHTSIKKKYTYLIEQLSPEVTGKYLASIKTKVKNTITHLVTHQYTEGKVMTEGDIYGMTYISYGRGKKKIGEIEEYYETCEYQVRMSVLNYRMKIDRIYENCIKEGK